MKSLTNKSRFVSIIKSLEGQWEYDTSSAEKLDVIYGPEANINPYNNNFLVESLISELCHLVGGNLRDANVEICRFLYDMNFGKILGSEYPGAEELYEHLIHQAYEFEVEAKLFKKITGNMADNGKSKIQGILNTAGFEEEDEPQTQTRLFQDLITEFRRWDNEWKDYSDSISNENRNVVKCPLSQEKFAVSLSEKYIIKKREE